VLVVDDARDHHVADVRVEGGRLAEHEDAAQAAAVDGYLPKDVVRGHPERVVDVHHDRLARREPIGVHVAQGRVEPLGP
jgi:hypothetical protein